MQNYLLDAECSFQTNVGPILKREKCYLQFSSLGTLCNGFPKVTCNSG